MIISRMIAKDNISISKFITSNDLRKGIELRTRELLPSSPTTVTAILKSFHRKVKIYQIDKLNKIDFIAISMDEWSSKTRRYLNVNAHISRDETICLGLSPIDGSATSERIYNLLVNKLDEFGIDISKVIASTNDGASVMAKIGKKLTIHNAVVHCTWYSFR